MGMTREELARAIQAVAGGSPVAMARTIGVSYKTLNDWQRGKSPIPETAAILIRLLLENLHG